MRAKSVSFFGKSDSNASGTVTFQANGASALSPSNNPIAATPTANCDRSPIGLMINPSVMAPNPKAKIMLMPTATQIGTQLELSHQAMNAEIIAISPCAKFR